MHASATHPVGWRAAAAPTSGNEPARQRRAQCAWLALALGLSAFVYFPITANFFNSDDFFHLYYIVNKPLPDFLLRMHGGHLLLTRNAVFVLLHEAFGTNVAGYLWAVLLTHLFNVFLLFRIIRELCDSPRLACFGAALWGTLSVQEGTLGWYSVYGHVLAATCILLVLSGLARAATGRPSAQLAPWLWLLLLLAAATSFGVGIGVGWAMLPAAWLLLPASPLRRRTLLAFAILTVLLPLLYFGLARLYGSLYGRMPPVGPLLAGLEEWRMHVALLAQLIGYGIDCVVLGILHRPAYAAGPAGYTVIAAYTVILLGVVARGSAAIRRRILACLTICVGAYGIIAVGRGGFTAVAGAAWMAHMPRFHYVGTAALVIATCLLLAQIAHWWPWRPAAATALLLVWIGLSALGQRFFPVPIDHFDAARAETTWALEQIRTAARAAPPGSEVFIENQPFLSVGIMLAASRATFPGWAALYTIYFPDDAIEGRRIRFVEGDRRALAALRDDRRTASLLVPPADAPADIYRPPERPHIVPSEQEAE